MIPKPMLCKEYKNVPDNNMGFVQPKLDGIRALAVLEGRKVVLYSRNGNILNLPHMQDSLLGLFCRFERTRFFDGELYIHGKSFQDIASMVKRKGHPRQDTISYHIYDRTVHSMPLNDFTNRFYLLNFPRLIYMIKVQTEFCTSKQQMDRLHASIVMNGYEGTIIRTGNCLYEEGKRSKFLLKRKDWCEEDFCVTKVREGRGKAEGTAIFTCSVDGTMDRFFDVTAPGNYSNKRTLFKAGDDSIGKLLSVRYQNFTDDGIPRFPIALGFKDDR